MQQAVSLFRSVRGAFLIAGTSIGAGMLGIPLVTASSGFLPASLVTVGVWLFMALTGLLLFEVTLTMPEGCSFLSISGRYLGVQGKIITGGLFVFLYYFLMIAYFAAGAPLMATFLEVMWGISLTGFWPYLLFGLVFASIVGVGPKAIDGTNFILILIMGALWLTLMVLGAPKVSALKLSTINWSSALFAAPVLFSSFGYHNMIPSLSSYMKQNVQVMRFSIVVGTAIPLVVYLFWQWLIIGAIEPSILQECLKLGLPVTGALMSATGNPWITVTGQLFAFLAIATSIMGVAFSLVDFLGDGINVERKGIKRLFLVLLVFLPPGIVATVDPTIFDKALGIAGGIGEALINGLLPVVLAFIVRYFYKIRVSYEVVGGKGMLFALAIASLFVAFVEALILS